MVSIGEMRQVGIFQSNTPVAQSSGGFKDSYSDVLTTRGKLERVGGQRQISGGQVEFSSSYDWFCRFQTGLVINKKSRWKIGDKYYSILGYELIDMKKFYYRFRLSEVE